jgi:hypothetical protein
MIDFVEGVESEAPYSNYVNQDDRAIMYLFSYKERKLTPKEQALK